jgi:hypothetical protein
MSAITCGALTLPPSTKVGETLAPDLAFDRIVR